MAARIRHTVYDSIVAHFHDSVRRIDAVYLGNNKRAGRSVCLYRARTLWLYIEWLARRVTGRLGLVYGPAGVNEYENVALAPGSVAAVVQRTWGNKVSVRLHVGGGGGGSDNAAMRAGMRWDQGRVLDVRLGHGGCSIEVTAAFTWLGAGAGALTPRELVVLLFALGRLSADDAVRVLHLRDVSANIMLDTTLDEVIATDGTPIAAAR